MSTFTEIFGDELVNPAGEPIKTESALSCKKAIGIYFSAHWCPPCRGFTPKLAESYKEFAADKGFEVVFVSSDKDETSFKDYHGKEMPWLALPFADRERKDTLSKKYKVNGIPTLVIIDGTTLKTITDDGRGAVSSDPHGAKFPWVPPTLQESLGNKLVGKNGSETTVQSVFEANDAVGVYFSAHWCGPCRQFTPKLIEAYNKTKENGKKFEVIFVSSDHDQSSFDSYYGDMPWLALPFEDRSRKTDLSTHFGVEGIPTFVVLDKNYKLVNGNARGAVLADPECSNFPWAPQPVGSLDSPDGINETPSLVLFAEKVEQARQAELVSALTNIAKPVVDKAKAEDKDTPVLFFAAKADSSVASRVRQLASLGDATAEPQVVLVDIGDSGAYYVFNGGDVTQDTLSKFVQDFLSGALSADKKNFS